MILLTAHDIRNHLGPRVGATFDDDRYVLPEHNWLLHDFLPWWRAHLRKIGMIHRRDIYDCDDFARGFVNALVQAARDLRAEAAVAVAMLRVRNLVRSLGVKPGSHCLNLVGVNRNGSAAWLVIEPQNNLHETLDRFDTADGLRAHF